MNRLTAGTGITIERIWNLYPILTFVLTTFLTASCYGIHIGAVSAFYAPSVAADLNSYEKETAVII